MLKPFYESGVTEAGCDEAGRGCLAGPVVAAAVILPVDFFHPLLNDSKQLTEDERNLLRHVIEKEAIDFAVGVCDHLEIDEINILKASFLAMHKALNKLKKKPGLILVDGNRFIRYQSIRHLCIVKGDGIMASIAAASVLAKTYRDEMMLSLHEEFPVYLWNQNKGYPTIAHRRAIEMYGPSPFHRKSFTLLKKQLEFEF